MNIHICNLKEIKIFQFSVFQLSVQTFPPLHTDNRGYIKKTLCWSADKLSESIKCICQVASTGQKKKITCVSVQSG